MDCLDSLQAHIDSAIHRRPGGRQDTRHGKRFVPVFDERYLPRSVRNDQCIAHFISQSPGSLSTDHRIVEIIEWITALYAQRLPGAVGEMVKKSGCGTYHSITAVRVTQRDGDRPLYLG